LNGFWSAILVLLAIVDGNRLWAASEDEARIENREGVGLAKQGDWHGALEAFETACRKDPFDDTALSNLACTHNNIGVFMVKEHRYSEAIRHFRAASAQKPEDLQIRLNLLAALVSIKDVEGAGGEALKILAIRPDDPDIHLQIARAFQKMEDDDAALTVLGKSVGRHPSHEPSLAQIARLHYNRGNLPEARFFLNRALEVNPGRAESLDLKRQLDREEPLESSFDRDTSIHFELTYQTVFSKEWVSDLLEIFETAYERGGDFLGVQPAQRVQVIVYALRDLRKAKSLPEWAGGVYDGKIRLPVSSMSSTPEQMTAAVLHEYCHHMVFVMTHGNCPTWLNEGLAQTLEGSDPARAQQILTGDDGKLSLIPLSKLEGPFTEAKSREEAGKMYAQSLLTVKYLIKEKGIPALRELLTNLGRQCSIQEAATMAFDDSLTDLEEKITDAGI